MVAVGMPLTLKPAPEMLTFEIVTFAAPALGKITCCRLLLDRFPQLNPLCGIDRQTNILHPSLSAFLLRQTD